jgi:hypothetical protein
VEDGDGPGELVGGDERLERKRRWPKFGKSALDRLNLERDDNSMAIIALFFSWLYWKGLYRQAMKQRNHELVKWRWP